jgi:hypothetical protein
MQNSIRIGQTFISRKSNAGEIFKRYRYHKGSCITHMVHWSQKMLINKLLGKIICKLN